MTQQPLLQVKGLKTHFFLDEGTVKSVDGADFSIMPASTVGVVGESGCGKSVTAFSILQLVSHPGRIVEGEILWRRNGQNSEVVDLAKLKPNSRAMRAVRGGEISMIFQEPMVSLSPVHTVGDQITEVLRQHRNLNKKDARDRAIDMLRKVGIPQPERRIDTYPFQMSGGMRQRTMIAMALACHPTLLIADEPTTALDVTTQAQILELMLGLQREFNMAIMMITHNLGVVAEICNYVIVMYLGEVVEQAPVDALFHDARHPYTQALLRSIPVLGQSKTGRLDPIKGMVPDPYNRPQGCAFHPRCDRKIAGKCDLERIPLTSLPDGRTVRCVLYQ
ncbi:oligopeptide/dipeptide ABC transporter, ATPase subunit [Candidatus Moduliflexus flocculans]|uniref:Oligopeptide/dipeptide ABC transporter, ATPase subunit n=1 Tax=Candidatus Moduliflexus flocculans TaxID=1499966 RepID=A0A081BP84_9BACT|nr:oligopeptide/dipeptide ABC transporter, ATPase subunit [Candidatus Moduliflexus flocculans]